MADKTKIVVVCGPTATGKTDLSIYLAERFGGEIISADSLQVYRGLDIGTAKATVQEQERVRHHLIDVLDPQQEFNVHSFSLMAAEAVKDIRGRGLVPFITGGTGLYIESFVTGTALAQHHSDPSVRASLQKELEDKGARHMYSRLVRIDPEYALKVHPNNTLRVIRAIEIYELTGYNMTYHIERSRPSEKPYDTLILGLSYTDRKKMYGMIDSRVDRMVENGLLDEARLVWENRDRFTTSANAIGYKEFFPYFEGRAGISRCTDEVKKASRHYAKRQLTWFSHMKDIHWLYRDQGSVEKDAEELVRRFLKDGF